MSLDTVCQTLRKAADHLSSGRLHRAERLCRQVLQQDAQLPDAFFLLGLIFHQSGQSAAAVDYLTKAIAGNPHIPAYYYNLGYIYEVLENREAAIRAYQQAIALKPDYAQALNNLGLILYEKDRLTESIVLFREAIRNKSDFTNAYYNLGKALQAYGKPAAALETYDQLLKLMPDSAETRFNRSLSLLLTGRWQEGWREYEYRFSQAIPRKHPRIENNWQYWDGSPFGGKRLLVIDEQGIGDTLQFIRYLPLVKSRGGTVGFATIKPLINLLRNLNGVDELLDSSDNSGYNSVFDLYVPLLSLPGIFKTVLETIPAQVPYIYPDVAKIGHWERRLRDDRIKIGIVWAGKTSDAYHRNRLSGLGDVPLVWAGRPDSRFASNRATRLEYFAVLRKISGIQLYGLQKGPAAHQVRELSQPMGVIDLGEELEDFSDTAAVIANMDLIISVDTAVAHLAGAMAKPVWVVIPFAADWRWLLDRDDSPWYPTLRLFRQKRRDDWGPVFERIAAELKNLVDQQAIK